MLSIVALLSGESIFVQMHDNEKRAEALVAHSKFESEHGDHLTLLNVYRSFTAAEREKTWCRENYLNARNLTYAREVRNQLAQICERLQLPITSCGADVDQVRKCLLTGLFANVAELQRDNAYMTLAGTTRLKAKIHPSSVLGKNYNAKNHARCVLFTELVFTGRSYMRTVTSIEVDWIEEVVPHCGYLNRISRFN